MCGRFAQALPPRDYYEIVNDQLNNDETDGGGSGGQSRSRRRERISINKERGKEDTIKEEEDQFVTKINLQSLLNEDDYHPTYNVAPGVQVPIIRLEEPVPLSSSPIKEEGKEQNVIIQTMRWGLIPHHSKTIPRGPDALKTINARDDVVLNGKSMWTPLLRKGQRCILFCQGFYEWLKKDFEGKQKVAHFIGMNSKGKGRKDFNGNFKSLMPIAGLWEKCLLEGKTEETYSFTIITTESNNQLNFLHDRMPVILPDLKSIKIWLGIQSDDDYDDNAVFRLLKPFQFGKLDCYPCPNEVGKVGNNNENFILPVKMRKDGIQAAFGKVKEKQQKVEDDDADATTETNAPLKEEIQSIEKVSKEEEEDDKIKVEKDSPPPIASSKYSPEPFNPPLSPERPKGGYSTKENPDPSPYKRKFTPTKSSPGGGMSSVKKRQLEESAKGSKDIRSFFK